VKDEGKGGKWSKTPASGQSVKRKVRCSSILQFDFFGSTLADIKRRQGMGSATPLRRVLSLASPLLPNLPLSGIRERRRLVIANSTCPHQLRQCLWNPKPKKTDVEYVLTGIRAAFDAGLRFGVSIQTTEDHLDLRLDLTKR
jgi:hypothetical protein